MDFIVAPYMGAWIETASLRQQTENSQTSLPTWGRGLKLCTTHIVVASHGVAPYMGAWIETAHKSAFEDLCGSVAPYMGAWIETEVQSY